MTNKSLLSLALACSMFAGAASASTAPSFDYVSAGFVTEKDDEIGDRANGVAGEFSKSFYDTQWFFFSDAAYASVDTNIGVPAEITTTTVSAQLGYKFSLAENTVAYVRAGAGYFKAEVEIGINNQGVISASESETAYLAAAGLRYRVSPKVELDGVVSYAKASGYDSVTTAAVGAKFFVTDAFSLGAGFSFGDDVTGFKAGLSYHF